MVFFQYFSQIFGIFIKIFSGSKASSASKAKSALAKKQSSFYNFVFFPSQLNLTSCTPRISYYYCAFRDYFLFDLRKFCGVFHCWNVWISILFIFYSLKFNFIDFRLPEPTGKRPIPSGKPKAKTFNRVIQGNTINCHVLDNPTKLSPADW